MSASSSDILYDVFISYARKDANMGAAPLDAALKQRCRVWRDLRDIDPAQDFTAEIEKAIKASRRVVVCVTPDVERDDSFVRREIAYASYLKKPLLVARFADVLPPIHVFNHTWVDFFRAWDDAFDKTWRWIGGEKVDNSAPDTPVTSPPADPYYAYVERLYNEAIETLRVSVLSDEAITLRTVESVDDVAKRTRRLNAKYLSYALRDVPEDDAPPATFESLRAAYESTGCDGRVLLLGEPGAGKTTSLLAFARDSAAERLSDPTKPLPVFARISGWDSINQPTLAEWIAGNEPELSAGELRGMIERAEVLLLLDGLDELGSHQPVDPRKPDGEQYDPRERFLKQLPPTSRIVLSSRLEEYRQIGARAGLRCAVRLEPLDDMQMQAYLENVSGLWDVVQDVQALKEVLRTPLLLALFRIGFQEAPEDTRMLANLGESDLIDRIFDVFIDRRWAYEQSRDPHTPLPYSASELKLRLGQAVVKAQGEPRKDYTRLLPHDFGDEGQSVITLARRLDLIQLADYPAANSVEDTHFKTYRFMHLRLRDSLAYPAALALLHDPQGSVRGTAAEILGNLGGKRVIEPLIEVLRDDPDKSARQGAAWALGTLHDGQAVDPLISALHEADPDVRRGAAFALGELKDTRAVIPLILSLRDPKWYVRSSAAIALMKLDDPRAVEPLLVASRDPDEDAGSSAYGALIGLRDERVVEILIETLHKPDGYLRYTAVQALGFFRDARATLYLLDLLRNDPNADVRRAAATALGSIRSTNAVDTLVQALSDPNPVVRSSAAEALRQFEDYAAASTALELFQGGKIKPRTGWLEDIRRRFRRQRGRL